MNGNAGLALMGVALILVGYGTCVVASVGFIDLNVVHLPLGAAAEHIQESTRGRWDGPIAGAAMVLVGVVLASCSLGRSVRDREREPKTRKHRFSVDGTGNARRKHVSASNRK